ncbi:cobalt ECF transporter T component CbiQ [Paenibacillus gansuensis]|uniref:Cobalt ECF transporter T component CbiQ n=1 Tax=Paenibacillus gansuensis TaxID=306542 RepID=A0ABW5P6L2_9BACL
MIKNITVRPNESSKVKAWIPNPKYRLICVLALVAAVVTVQSMTVLSWTAGFVLFAVLWSGVPFRFVLGRLVLLIPFGFAAAVMLPFTTPGEPVFTGWFGLTATEEGLARSAVIMLKLVNANLLIAYIIAVTPLFDLIRSMRAIGIPAVMVELLGMLLRYLFLLMDEGQSMLKAQKSRGLRLQGRFWSDSVYRRCGQLLGSLFLRALSRSGRIYQSIRARGGFDGTGTPFSEEPEDRRGGDGMGQSAVEVNRVCYRYGDREALRDITFSVQARTKMALMGPNGAGKSTLISLLNGLEQPSTGTVTVLGQGTGAEGGRRGPLAGSRVGVVYQDPDDQIFSTTVGEDVAFGPRNQGLGEEEVEDRVRDALEAVGIADLRGRSPFELSYGQKRRVAIAGVLAMKPTIVVLDEPMAFLDPKGRDDLQSMLEAMHLMGITLIVATHDVDFAAEWADQVLILKQGRLLVSGGPDLLFDDAVIAAAELHLPRLARPFRLLEGVDSSAARPKTVREAAQLMWRLLRRRPEDDAMGGDGVPAGSGREEPERKTAGK